MVHQPGPRVHVVGTSGSGKTSVARRLAAARGVRHIELDGLHWLPGWAERGRDEFRALLEAELGADAWVVCGNYLGRARDLLWARATTIVWLDLPRHQVMRQVVGRTLRRWWYQEVLWNGNREQLTAALFRPADSILWWAWTSHNRRKRTYAKLLGDLDDLRIGPWVPAMVGHRPVGSVRRWPGGPSRLTRGAELYPDGEPPGTETDGKPLTCNGRPTSGTRTWSKPKRV